MKVKICGITDVETAKVAVAAGADAIGFVFAPSKRRIEVESAKAIIEQLPAHIEKVGVFVNEDVSLIEDIATTCGLTLIQLHGEESYDNCRQHSLPVVKAVGISSTKDVCAATQYEVPYLLVDSPKGQHYQGGNGETFNWELLQAVPIDKHRLILAGGLNAENVSKAIQVVNPYMVDVSSGVETNGVKDHEKIIQFIQAAKGAIRR